ncbi:CRISPR-associated protein, Csd1 family [Magnetococcus marinus MC-1]|uniref:CRISPR-associated protein, Csd1 family n=1 Tax=Magnetococcus marinus (strain ATCC BAA-1437 / JCM 17883 / MC-1) TaxID=156889 RepID=A0LDG3_MAGMM|nr:type I-C CRISPR-associated protein Cas8c/Csd1 [Magnetococcus marinus]ABK46006.1 CRISPR-associated protein, Csd1 family [Magnetococcus marinus MC-1]
MSWMQMLHTTYECCKDQLGPIYHTTQQAHLEVVLDHSGTFLRAHVPSSKTDSTTLIPCSEKSAGRTSGLMNHPLADKLQYVAGDYLSFAGALSEKEQTKMMESHRLYKEALATWADSPQSHPTVKAIYAYVAQGRLVGDLVNAGILPCVEGSIPPKWQGPKEETPAIYKAVTGMPLDAFVRWRVEPAPGVCEIEPWNDPQLIQAWIDHYLALLEESAPRGTCMVTGQTDVLLAQSHPAKLRHAADKAKLISANDSSGYTYRGRFLSADEVCGVGLETTQQVHNTLRWLIEKQGYRQGDLRIVAWAVDGRTTPGILISTQELLGDNVPAETEEEDELLPTSSMGHSVDQSFGLRLGKKISGYYSQLGDLTDIVVMGIDSATPGRMSIIYYRELQQTEFLQRLEKWHSQMAWPQNFGKDSQFTGAPAPRDIAEAAYGRRLDDKLKSTTLQRILPCIIDEQPFPEDLIHAVVHRTSNRVAFDRSKTGFQWEWEKCLGIACALVRGSNLRAHIKKEYAMALEPDYTSRDYLYGRLLALADYLEEQALHAANEHRATNAARLMQRFSQRPNATWLTIYDALLPYKNRLQVNKPGLYINMMRELDNVMNLFAIADYQNDAPLKGEYLLGYHCQRAVLWAKKGDKTGTQATETE